MKPILEVYRGETLIATIYNQDQWKAVTWLLYKLFPGERLLTYSIREPNDICDMEF